MTNVQKKIIFRAIYILKNPEKNTGTLKTLLNVAIRAEKIPLMIRVPRLFKFLEENLPASELR